MNLKKIIVIAIVIAVAVWVLALITKKENEYVAWSEATSLFESCKVDFVTQAQTLDITLNLKDGSTIFTKAPGITSVGEQVQTNSAKCGTVEVSTAGF